jgi:chromosome partitioning protein
LPSDDYCLGEIPDFQGLLPKSNEAGVPVFAVTNEEIKETGPVLKGFQDRRKKFRKQFEEITGKIISALAYA